MAETSLSSLVKEIGEALVLDDNNQDQEAYKKYVSCIYKIATNLIVAIQKSGGHVVVDSKTSKQVKLVQQCVERVSSLLEKMDRSEYQPPSLGMQPPSPVVTPTSNSREIAPSNTSTDMKSEEAVRKEGAGIKILCQAIKKMERSVATGELSTNFMAELQAIIYSSFSNCCKFRFASSKTTVATTTVSRADQSIQKTSQSFDHSRALISDRE